MEKNFEDIFESIKLLHKKYNSEEYISNLDELNRSSKDIERILEKYDTNKKKINKSKKRKLSARN